MQAAPTMNREYPSWYEYVWVDGRGMYALHTVFPLSSFYRQSCGSCDIAHCL